MRYSDNFLEFSKILAEFVENRNTVQDINQLKKLIKAIIAFMDLTAVKDEQFKKSIEFHRRQFEIDLKILVNGENKSLKMRKIAFYECQKELKIDLHHAITGFKHW